MFTRESRDLGLGIIVHDDIKGYAVVEVDGKVVKRFTNKREDALGNADRFAQDIWFKRQRERTW